MLGPSLLGAVAPRVSATLFPESVLPLMTGVAQVGLVLFMFGVGWELGGMRLRGAVGRSLAVSQASLMIPLAAGAATALLLVDRYAPPGVHPGVFVFYIGCALSITAFPVLFAPLDGWSFQPLAVAALVGRRLAGPVIGAGILSVAVATGRCVRGGM